MAPLLSAIVGFEMATREIRTYQPSLASACDVCGRTLLRGENAHPFLDGAEPRIVCELCTNRAGQEGWLREGTVPSYDGRGAGERRRSLLGRLRTRREPSDETGTPTGAAEDHVVRAPDRIRRRQMEPRHVRAVPTAPEQRIAAAVEAFNNSRHPRTVAGVGRSLGAPTVAIRPDPTRPSLVYVTVAWELSWYRYEIDLADEDEPVRVANQGSELSELSPDELEPAAACDDSGLLVLGR